MGNQVYFPLHIVLFSINAFIRPVVIYKYIQLYNIYSYIRYRPRVNCLTIVGQNRLSKQHKSLNRMVGDDL